MRPPTAAVVVLLASMSLTPQRGAPALPRAPAAAQSPEGDAVTAAELAAAIESLGTIDFDTRMSASRTVRRAEPSLAVPALIKAVTGHADQYARFRALVLLSGFNDPRTRDVMRGVLGDRNDRLRAVAYTYFEHNADPSVVPVLIAALATESSEFVRPALSRALAAYGSDPRAQATMKGLVMQGAAYFRSGVIEALGDYRAAYALAPITEVARIDGPLQDDAALALGKIGDKAALSTLVSLQRSAPRESQPAVAAAICLLGVNCGSHEPYVIETLRFAIATFGFQELLRASAAALAELAVSGREAAADALIKQGAPTQDPARAAIALSIGTLALRNTPLTLSVLGREGMLEPGSELLREAFDMLEEDYEEERFFVAVRRAYWQAPQGSAARTVCQTLIRKLEF
jgi:HEAT repeat protein